MADHGITSGISEALIVDGSVSPDKLSAGVQDEILDIEFEDGVSLGHGEGTITLTVVDASGNAATDDRYLVDVWTSGRGGAAEGVPLAIAGEFTVTAGTEVKAKEEKAHLLVLTDASGQITMLLDDNDEEATLYLMARIGGKGGYGSVDMAWH